MRYVICGHRRPDPTIYSGLFVAAACVYISRKGCTTYRADNAAVIRSLAEAKKEIDYWRINQPRYKWHIEQLPRGPVATAILRGKPVESELELIA